MSAAVTHSPGRQGRSKGPASAAFDVGDSVLALWPHSGLYYPSSVVRVLSGGRYEVQFQDKENSKFMVASSSVMSATRSRPRSRSRSRSPGRRRRSVSPGRRPRSPSRQAPPTPKAKPAAEKKKLFPEEPAPPAAVAPVKMVDGVKERWRSRRQPGEAVSSSLPLSSGAEDVGQSQAPTAATAQSGSGSGETSTVTDGRDQAESLSLGSGASTGAEKSSKPNFEFGGPVGALLTMLSLPLVILALYSACSPQSCSIQDVMKARPPPLASLFSMKAVLVVLAWLAFHTLLYYLPIGQIVYGQTLRDGTKLPYKINAWHTMLISCVEAVALTFYGHKVNMHLDPVYVYDNYLQLATAALLVSAALSVFLYAYSFRKGAMLAAGGNTGNAVYDFFIGRELNPRIGTFDLKIFCELRPGLIGWVIVNFCMAYTQYAKHGYVSNSMLLVNVFQFIYVADGIFAEQAILTTMDIISDGFGFMLAFGDLAWVPFVYTLQARYLVDRPTQLPTWAVAFLIGLNMLGFFIFRSANGQKDQFRTNPQSAEVAHLETIPTSTGRTLLADGWWAMCRKPNYLGDLMMALAWCGTCGVDNILCYFYFIYFAILLIHRQRRDDLHCERKYGEAWREYVRRVPYRIVPGIF